MVRIILTIHQTKGGRMKPISIHARDLIKVSEEDAWKYLAGDIDVIFDDNSRLLTKAQHTIQSLYFWRVIKKYDLVELLPKYHLTHHIGYNGLIDPMRHSRVMEEIVFDAIDIYRDVNNDIRDKYNIMEIVDDLKKMTMKLLVDLACDLNDNCVAWMSSIDYTDFVNISFHEPIREIMLQQDGSDEMVQKAYAIINAELKSPALDDNMLARAARGKIVRGEQLLQCIGPVGRRTDTDSHIFPAIITNGFIHGTRKLIFDAQEARSCAKALANSKDPLQKSEYFSRKMQFINYGVTKIVRGDCGTTDYMDWYVEPARIEDGKQIASDFDTMQGIYMLNASGGLSAIRKTDKHIIGTTIKIRAVAKCRTKEPGAICEYCYGDTSIGIPEKSNAGHQSGVRFYADESQLVISTKHHDGNAIMEIIRIAEAYKKFIHVPHGSYKYYLRNELRSKLIKVIVTMKHAMGIADIEMTRDVSKLSLSRVSSLPSIRLVYANKHGDIETVSVPTSHNKINTNFTHEFLEYVKKAGWENKEGGLYEFNMKDWNYDNPILSLQMRQINMSDFQAEVADMIESTVKELKYRVNVVTPEALLREFHSSTKTKLPTHLSILQTILFSGMVISNENNDYRLPKPWTDAELGVLKKTMVGRSVGALYAYERHHDMVTDPFQFLDRPMPDHPFDGLLLPEQVFGPKYGRTYPPKSKYHIY